MAERLSVDDEDWWEERPESRHRAGFGSFFTYGWPPLFMAGLCLVFACVGFLVPAKEGPLVGRIVGVVSLVGALACLVFGIVRWAGLVKSVDIHAGGVAWTDSGGEHRAGWHEIVDFYRTEVLVNGAVSTRQVVIKTDRRREAVFTYALSGWKRMADRMQQETSAQQLPTARQRFQAGETLRFGQRVALSQDGLRLDGKPVTWDRIRGVQVRNGYLLVSVAGKGDVHEIPLGETPNVGVLLALLGPA